MACPVCGMVFEELQPRMFSFNSPFGACEECNGLGFKMVFDPDLIIPNKDLCIVDGAIEVYKNSLDGYRGQLIEAVARQLGFDLFTPLRDLTPEQYAGLMYGTKERLNFTMRARRGDAQWSHRGAWEGLLPQSERLYAQTQSDYRKRELERFMRVFDCPTCKGSRLKEKVRSIRIADSSIIDVTNLSISACLRFLPRARTDAEAAADRPARDQGDPGAARVPRAGRARVPDPLASGRDPLGRRGAADTARDPDRREPDGRALRPGRALDRAAPARQPAADRHPARPPRPRQHPDRGRARRGHDPCRGLRDRHRPGGGGPRRADRRDRHPREIERSTNSLTGLYLAEVAEDRYAELAAPGRDLHPGQGRAREQPEERRRRHPDRRPDRRDRRLRLGQVHARLRDPLQGAPPAALRDGRSAGRARRARARRPDRQGDRDRPVPDWPDPALEPGHLHQGLRRHPEDLRRDPGGEGPGVPARPVLVQRPGRAVRGLPGRRADTRSR